MFYFFRIINIIFLLCLRNSFVLWQKYKISMFINNKKKIARKIPNNHKYHKLSKFN